MNKIAITPIAHADLCYISRYTDQKWGRQQRLIYIKQLTDRCASLAEKPHLGKRREEIIGSPYSYHEGRHVIFYRNTTKGIEILRVLHDSMDFPRHFISD